MRTLAFVVLLTLSGCSGIQFGDDDESSGVSCPYREQPVGNLTQVPAGFTETAAAILSPATSSYGGILTLASGEQVPLSVSFALYEQSVRVIDAKCMAPTLRANLDLTIDAGETLSGVATCEVGSDRGGILFLSTFVGMEPNVTTTLTPSFTHPTLGPPSALTVMTHRDGIWSGNWAWQAFTDCDDAESCPYVERVLLGSVTLSRGGPL